MLIFHLQIHLVYKVRRLKRVVWPLLTQKMSRDPAKVAEDVRLGFVTAEAAAHDYRFRAK